MAAVIPFIETQQWSFPDYGPRGLSGLGDAAKVQLTADQMVAASNIEQTRLLYTRTLLQRALAGKTFSLVLKGNDIKIELSSAFDRETIPWARSSSNIRTISLFSTNSKMRCPTFDLPAGAPKIGGTCPAAEPAQTTSLQDDDAATSGIVTNNSFGLPVLKWDPSIPYRLHEAVCSYCYATGGKYGEPTVQIAELVREAVTRAAIERDRGQFVNPEMREAFIQAVLWQIPRLPYDRWLIGKIKKRDASGVDEDDAETAPDAEPTITREAVEAPEQILKRMSGYPNVIRVHSSGDFYDVHYAQLWIEIAQRLYQQHGMKYQLWAPTRTHVLPAFRRIWNSGVVPPNFTIRPSAYHLADSAPMVDGIAAGTSVLTPSDAAATKGIKYDHQCGVYDLAKGNKTCVDAKPPGWREGDPVGCRACWVRPELRVNYVAH